MNSEDTTPPLEVIINDALRTVAPNYLRIEFRQDGGAFAEVIAENGRKRLGVGSDDRIVKAIIKAVLEAIPL